jgi:acetoin utilization protein AcuB
MKDFNHAQLPVVDKDNKLLGIITDKLIEQVDPSGTTSLRTYEINYLLNKTKVENIMITGVSTVTANTFIEDAALLMKECRLKFLPVVDENKVLTGIITRTDIFKAFIDSMGVKLSGTRLLIITPNKTGVIADITGIISKHNIDIVSINSFVAGSELEITIKVNTLDTTKLVEALKDNKYTIANITVQR